ncbi:hypothetical protein BD410DRAFT_808387 [Rickenella mellea]|uniref:DUF6533 domain-containing protein n=1 Tax=Rickenella mellea TaxID=50990 RepID=A0A4Y7PLF7_9AGAM|nr:hypothetical protein BD410DRAFT_808387 [Rickenella mellea]
MSDGSEAAIIKELFSDSIRSNRVFLSSSVVVFYDYALTLPMEISEIWNAKFSGAQVIFFMTRYSFIFTTILQYVSRFSANPTDSLCRGVYYITIVSVTCSQIGLLGISTVVVSVYSDIHLVTPLADPFGFKFPTSCAYATDPGFSRSINEPVLDFRIRSRRLQLDLRENDSSHDTNEEVKVRERLGLRHTTRRFQLIIQTAIIIVFNGVSWDGELSTIGNVLTCRLVLNLRQVSRTPKLQTISLLDAGPQEEPEFATNSILGNIGAPLRIGREVDDEEDLESPVDDQISLEAVDTLHLATTSIREGDGGRRRLLHCSVAAGGVLIQ